VNAGLDIYSLLLVAVGLAMDAFSVATVTGFNHKDISIGEASKMSLSFGAFHVFMPLLGWYAGSTVVLIISKYDHWVAFLLLLFVGGRMIYEAFGEGVAAERLASLRNMDILLFSVAVSIDAVAVGLSFYLEKIRILVPALATGVVTALFTIAGIGIGNQTGQIVGKWSQVLGGTILILIGLRIVLTHIFHIPI
jgi:putative Mn2+ efflux pump MntP